MHADYVHFSFVMVSVGIFSEMICLFKKEKANLLQLVQFQAVVENNFNIPKALRGIRLL